jgi:hypothetical protein
MSAFAILSDTPSATFFAGRRRIRLRTLQKRQRLFVKHLRPPGADDTALNQPTLAVENEKHLHHALIAPQPRLLGISEKG